MNEYIIIEAVNAAVEFVETASGDVGEAYAAFHDDDAVICGKTVKEHVAELRRNGVYTRSEIAENLGYLWFADGALVWDTARDKLHDELRYATKLNVGSPGWDEIWNAACDAFARRVSQCKDWAEAARRPVHADGG